MMTTTRSGIRVALCLALVAVVAATGATWLSPRTPAGAIDAPAGAQPDPVLEPSTTPTQSTGFTFKVPVGEHCNGSGADGWRFHTFIVNDGVDLSTLNFTGANSGSQGYVGADWDGSDGTIEAPLYKGSAPTINGLPAVSPPGQINPSALSGFNFDPSVFPGFADGVYQIGFACTAPGLVLDQWWSNRVSIDADASSGTFMTVEAATSEPAATTVALDADPDTATVGTEVTFTATVTPSAAAGSVEFFVDDASQSTKTVSGGTTTWATSDLTVGTKSITAKFTPDDAEAFRASTSEPLSYTVSAAEAEATSVTLTADPEGQADLGEEVTLTAAVEPSEAAGTVAFAADGFTLAAPVTVSAGVATFPTSDLEAGQRSLTATFTPEDPEAFTEATGALSYTVVGPAGEATTLTLTADPASGAPVGEPVTLTATVDPPEATGTVVFNRITDDESTDDESTDDESTDDESTGTEDDATVSAAATEDQPVALVELGAGAVPLAEGTANLTISDLPVGEHKLQATFTPDDETAYQASTSETVVLTVTDPADPPGSADPDGENSPPGEVVANTHEGLSSSSGLPRTGLGLGGVVVAFLLVYAGRVTSLLARPSNATTRR